jgi:hypothetical protein
MVSFICTHPLLDEKSVCSDVSHASDKTFTKIKQETEALSQLGIHIYIYLFIIYFRLRVV